MVRTLHKSQHHALHAPKRRRFEASLKKKKPQILKIRIQETRTSRPRARERERKRGKTPQPTQPTDDHHRADDTNEEDTSPPDRRPPPPQPPYADELRTTITSIDFERSRRSRPPRPPYANEGTKQGDWYGVRVVLIDHVFQSFVVGIIQICVGD